MQVCSLKRVLYFRRSVKDVHGTSVLFPNWISSCIVFVEMSLVPKTTFSTCELWLSVLCPKWTRRGSINDHFQGFVSQVVVVRYYFLICPHTFLPEPVLLVYWTIIWGLSSRTVTRLKQRSVLRFLIINVSPDLTIVYRPLPQNLCWGRAAACTAPRGTAVNLIKRSTGFSVKLKDLSFKNPKLCQIHFVNVF